MLIAVDHREFRICYAAMTDRIVADTYKTLLHMRDCCKAFTNIKSLHGQRSFFTNEDAEFKPPAQAHMVKTLTVNTLMVA